MPTPYVTPQVLADAETGIDWSIIPSPEATPAQSRAELYRVCWRATTMVDEICNQVLRATINPEEIIGPHLRLTVDRGNGMARAIVSRWPVLSILSASYTVRAAQGMSPITIPDAALTIVHQGLAQYGTNAYDASGAGPAFIDITPGYITWRAGRNGYRLLLTYINGWPHSSLTAAASVNDQVLQIDDCTGWAGCVGRIKDGENEEGASVLTVSATSGPGEATLVAPLARNHAKGTVFTTLPETIELAAIWAATSIALERGATATTVQAMPGSETGGGKDADDLKTDIEIMLKPYTRTI